MQSKTTRAFRTISEAGEELGLQPHVLRFWESKFSQIKPIKRGGGRRFYRPEDIEFLRGIKKLLHDEKHPIKDVQKLIRAKGPERVVELGRSIQKASKDRDISETNLVPERIKKTKPKSKSKRKPVMEVSSPEVADDDVLVLETPYQDPPQGDGLQANVVPMMTPHEAAPALSAGDRAALEAALERLIDLKQRWEEFKQKSA